MPNDRVPQLPSAVGLAQGASGPEVQELQGYLARFGYLSTDDPGAYAPIRPEALEPSATPAVFDGSTEQALRRYQQFHGLPETGQLDDATVAEMSRPRCGFPDVLSSTASEFLAQGNRWTTNDLRYGFQNFTGDLTEAQIRGAVSAAFGLWSAVTPLSFREVPFATNPEIKIRFVAGDHGDGPQNAFDGAGGILAHAFFPPPFGGDIEGDAHFDEAETWTVDLPVAAGGTDLVTVAAHEFGHSLGLDHSSVSGALMFPTISGARRFLSQDDIDGIRSIYPPPGIGPTPRVAAACNAQGELHVLAVDVANGLWHTMRAADGSWPFPFGNVQAAVPGAGPGPTPRVAAACNAQGELHVLAVDVANGLWHTMRAADGSWPFPLGNVQAAVPGAGPGPTPRVAAACNAQGELHVLAVDVANGLWHTMRAADGSWPFPLGNVQAAVPGAGPGPTPRVAAACNAQGELHVLAVDVANGLWHTMRAADGSWPFPLGNVQAAVPGAGPGPTPRVAAACNAQGELHVLAVDVANGLWHTMRAADGSWPFPLGNVQAAVPGAGPGPTPEVAAACNAQGELHVLAVDVANGLWHTMRAADGSWPFPLGDVQAAVPG